MTTPSDAAGTPRRGVQRRRIVLAAVLVVAAASIWWVERADVTATPPEVELKAPDPPLARALATARERVSREPHSASAWGEYGKLLLANEFREPARLCFAEAEKLDDGEPRWPYLLGRSWLPADAEASLPHLRRAAQLARRRDPTNPAPWLQLGTVLLETGQLAEAEACLQRARDIEPNSVPIHLSLGLLADAQGDAETARSELANCLDHASTRRTAHARLAVLAHQQGRTDEAQRHSIQAAELPPDQPWPDPYLLECKPLILGKEGRLREVDYLERREQYREAASLLAELLGTAPDADLYVRLGGNLARVGDPTGAEGALRAALKIQPNHVTGHLLLGELHRLLGRLSASRGDMQKARAHYAEALAAARAALAAHPLNSKAFELLGLILNQMDRHGEAVEALQKAVRLGPGNTELLIHLATAEVDAGWLDDAQTHLEQAAHIPGADNALLQAALAHLKEGQNKWKKSRD